VSGPALRREPPSRRASLSRTRAVSGTLAVAIHDVEPRSSARTRAIREWLLERGVARVTLLVIPAAELHPIGARAPALVAWLRGRVACGDTVAQHGLSHRSAATARWPRGVLARWQAGDAAEFVGLSAEETARRVLSGRRLLREIELDPGGFVAPGYVYTKALRGVLGECFEWFADLRCIHTPSGGCLPAPALCLGSSTPLRRALSPGVIRAAARLPSPVMRVDIHPADFDLPGHIATLQALLDLAVGRDAVAYDELLV
jgi:predicted deacetylase